MELRHLRAFEAAARLLHFRRAAEELHLAQPSLSTQIAALERELGTPLFDRVGRRVRLTAAGEELLPHARRILDAVAEARRAVAAHEGLEGGRVRVGAPPTVGTRLLPAALTLFHARYPGPEILLREEGTGELLALVEHGELDVAVVILPLVSPALEVTPLLEEDIVVAVGAQHRLAGATAVAMTDLADEPFLLLGEGYEVRRTTLDACRAAGFHPYVVLEGGEMDTVLNLAAAGVGIALVPALAVDPGGPLVGLRIADQTRRRALGVVRLRERYFTPAARAFRDCLVEQARLLPAAAP